MQKFENILKMHCENLEKNFLNCVEYQNHLIQYNLNEIILLKLKNLRKFWKFYCKIFEKYWKFMAKIWNNFQNFYQNFLQILFKIHKTNFKISIFNTNLK